MSYSSGNINSIIAALHRRGITNQYLVAGILATTAKETGIKPISENLNYTSAARLMHVWPNLFPTTQSAQPFLNNPEKLGNLVYGGKGGNSPSEGFKYRARGYNGLTFKNNYKYYGDKIGVNLVSNPELANDPKLAAELLAVYYDDHLKRTSCSPSRYSQTGSGQISDLETGVKTAVAITAGCPSAFGNVLKEDLQEALTTAPELLKVVKNYRSASISRFMPSRSNLALAIAITFIVLIVIFLIIKRNQIADALS